MTLIEAVAKRPIGYEYQFNSFWSIERNFNIKHTELHAYCEKHGILINEKHDKFQLELYFDKFFKFNEIKDKTFETTAVLHTSHKNEQYYHHFGITEVSASLYGDKPEDIVNLSLHISDDQTINPKATEYWGFYDYAYERFSLIYPAWCLLDICFPGAIKGAEDYHHSGFAAKLDVKLLEK